jgi:hypothetical protein
VNITDLHGDVARRGRTQSDRNQTQSDLPLRRVRQPGLRERRPIWRLGGKTRKTELPSGVIQMGRRSYVPALGRFLRQTPFPEDRPTRMTTRTKTLSTALI